MEQIKSKFSKSRTLGILLILIGFGGLLFSLLQISVLGKMIRIYEDFGTESHASIWFAVGLVITTLFLAQILWGIKLFRSQESETKNKWGTILLFVDVGLILLWIPLIMISVIFPIYSITSPY